jgi:hypothetical protein
MLRRTIAVLLINMEFENGPKAEVELKTKGNMGWRSSGSSLSRTGRSDGIATPVPRS